MGVTTVQLFRRADAIERRWCVQVNQACQRASVRRFFAAISRLGDGVFWYALVVSLPILFGERGILPAIRMALVALVGVVLYKFLKSHLIRERPYVSHLGIVPGTPALDRYSFPSGHTLHAVSLAILTVESSALLALIVTPFALLVAASRVVLGLHYPSDVLAGALLGAGLAFGAMWLIPIA